MWRGCWSLGRQFIVAHEWTVCLPWRPSHSWLSKHRQFIPSTTPGLLKPPSGYLSTVTLVILSAFSTCPILASPTTEPGRRGWKRRLGSPLSAPHFLPAPRRLRRFKTDTSGFPLCSSVPPVVQAFLFDRNLRCGRKRHKPPRFAALGSN